MNKDNTLGLSIGLLAGAMIGGVVALLFAPKTGKETRQLVKNTAVNMVDAVRGKTVEVAGVIRGKTLGVIEALKS